MAREVGKSFVSSNSPFASVIQQAVPAALKENTYTILYAKSNSALGYKTNRRMVCNNNGECFPQSLQLRI